MLIANGDQVRYPIEVRIKSKAGINENSNLHFEHAELYQYFMLRKDLDPNPDL